MQSEESPEELELKRQVEASELELESLFAELRRASAELEHVEEQRQQFAILADVCSGLDELGRLDVAGLFWGDEDALQVARRIDAARGKVGDFEQALADAARQRDDILRRIDASNASLDNLHVELHDAMEREERRRDEWIVERDADELPYRAQVMPWTRGVEEDRRFRQSLAASVLVCLMLGWLFSAIDLPAIDREMTTAVPERVAKLVRQERRPPPPPIEEELFVDQEPPEPEEVDPQDPQDEPEVIQPGVAQAEQDAPVQQVRSKGVLAFRDRFSERASLAPSAELGLQARMTNAGDTRVGRPERMMVSTTAVGSSGGINLADISRDVGGAGPGLDGIQVTRVASAIGGADGPERPLSGGAVAGRTDEEIQIVFDRYKAALYRLYNRELRNNPTLRGQLVLRLTIEPDGSVSMCALHSSDMGAQLLADQVVDRVSGFDFGAKEGIAAMTIIYPIDFLPTA